MATKLTKYSQAQDIAGTDTKTNDINTPFTFQDWITRNVGIIPGKEQLQYENYVKDWYKNKTLEIPTSQSVKEDYINLLKQLTLAFKSEADAVWATDINFDDPDEIVQVIPFYATKLKEIAIYLINKREAVRRAKLKYNMTGTYASLERVFYEYLLKAFTKRQFPGNEYVTTITDLSVLNVIPELSAVRSGFQIFVDELYDDASYFDRDPKVPVSAYFSFNADATAYLECLNIAPSDYEWLYSTGVSNLCADNPLLWLVDDVLNQYKLGIPLSALELTDSTVLNDYNRIKLAQKYIGEQQYILSGGYWTAWTDTVDFNIGKTNNWFYWLTGENVFENDTMAIIDPISLSATSLIDSGATAGNTITAADVIYVNRNNSLSGAWLRLADKLTITPIMSARLDKGKTIFAFPFPGYGLSGEDLDWTGRSLDNLDRTFFYLDNQSQQAVYNAYWSSGLTSVSSFDPLYINDTTLVLASAKAADTFDKADYVITRPSFRDSNPDFVYTDEQQYAWLYKMTKTDIPIKVGDNNIYWPFERYDGNVSMVARNDQCAPMNLSDIGIKGLIGAVAGFKPTVADRIFKKSTPNATDYSEGAWLKGATYLPPQGTGAGMVSGCYQPNIAMRVLAGDYGSFIWIDPTASANTAFKGVQHQNDCWYLKDSQFSLYNERPTNQKNLNYNQWQDCSCRAVLYSPLGHPGDTFDEYAGMADFIVAITTPASSFSFKDWVGIDGKPYTSSSEFGWFKLNGQYSVEPDVGWGSGDWVTNNGDAFMLSTNVLYLYFRNDMHRDTPNSNAPYIVTKYNNINGYNQWFKMYYNKNTSTWDDAGVETDMIINPGDMLYYSHPETCSFTLTSQYYKYCIQQTPVMPDQNSYNLAVSTDPILGINSFNVPITTTMTSFQQVVTSLVVDSYTYTNDTINFMMNVGLKGWNYNASTYDPTVSGARPIWVIASDKDDNYTKQKSIDVWSGSPVLVDDYNFITQPSYSNMSLGGNTYIEYNKRDLGSVTWVQPIKATVAIQEKKWCKLLVDRTGVSNLSATLYNNINELVVSATNIASDLILDVIQDSPLLVNYYARKGFTWSQKISNSSLGLPPTGGVWTPVLTGNLVTPDAPYVHLSNRHYPTYATAPAMGELYSTKDSGGYFVPRMLGASTAVSKNVTNVLNTSKIDNDPSKRGMTAIYRDLNIYGPDRGLSNGDQFEPVEHISTDSTWMKASVMEGQKAGMITHAKTNSEFMPYQTKYENIGSNDNGLYRQGNDAYDPWFGDLDITWENNTDWPANWRKQYDINGWYEQQNNGGQQIYQWKTDIFGNQYAVLKNNFLDASIYNKKHYRPGTLWTRNARNIIQPANVSLAKVFTVIPDISGIDIISMVNETSGVLDMDIWFDTMMIYTAPALFFFRLDFDYDTGIISSTSDESNYILTTNSKFGGTWFFSDDKKVTVCTLLSCGDQIRPILRSLDLETSQMSYLYNITASDTDMSSFSLSSYDHSVLTYDTNTKTYNISYISYSTEKAGMYLTTINIRDYGEYHGIVTAKTIVPKSA